VGPIFSHVYSRKTIHPGILLAIKCYLFSFSGHYLYTKSAQLYLQDMVAPEQRMDPTEFKIFTERNFTIRRFDKIWSGLWSDLIADVVYEKLD
jgi:hypothetical protein